MSGRFEDGGIRPYGPGKFDTILDGHIYTATLDGCCESLGDSETFNHYDKVELGPEGVEWIEGIAKETDADTLTDEERALIRDSAGAIVEENSQGFVLVEFYDSKKKLDEKWEELEQEWSEFEGDED